MSQIKVAEQQTDRKQARPCRARLCPSQVLPWGSRIQLGFASLASLARYARCARLGFASARTPRLRHAGRVGGYSKVLHGSSLALRVASRGMAKGRCAKSHLPKEWGAITLSSYVLGGTSWQHWKAGSTPARTRTPCGSSPRTRTVSSRTPSS